jgi:hypothetical protein
MNTSRDIEKLFDHFGGNAGDYQEIGRENEARSARTRWPLLATLDFAQPTIPEIAPRRDVRASFARDLAGETTPEPAEKPTPIHRGRPQLFTRPHRRTIPAVSAPAAESLSALRFSALDNSATMESGTIPASTVDAATVADVPAPPPVQAVAPEPVRTAATFGSSFLARRAPAQAVNDTPRPQPAAEPAPQSILGKLFKPQAAQPASAPANPLQSMFDRLRHADAPASASANEPTTTQASAGHAVRASRLPRS